MSKEKFPDWANEKQKEGMQKVQYVVDEYGGFDFQLTFRERNYSSNPDTSRFYADVSWSDKSYTFDVEYDHEVTWDCCGERIHCWQFLFGGGDATREVSSEVFFISLFDYLNRVLEKGAA